jgi:LDH2 family malate/lactate/ureidoglycolate dehydrogenase
LVVEKTTGSEDPAVFKQAVDKLVRDIRGSEKLPGVERIWLPGEQSHEKRQAYETQGIPVAPFLIDELNLLATELKINPMINSNKIILNHKMSTLI